MAEQLGESSGDELYLMWVDAISSRADQLQSDSDDRHLLGSLGIEEIIVYLCGGIASGLLARYGESLAEQSAKRLKQLVARRARGSESTDLAGMIAGVDTIFVLVVDHDDFDGATRDLIRDLTELGLEEGTAETVAHAILRRPSAE